MPSQQRAGTIQPLQSMVLYSSQMIDTAQQGSGMTLGVLNSCEIQQTHPGKLHPPASNTCTVHSQNIMPGRDGRLFVQSGISN
jgi:hypothetical protein